MKTLLFVIAIAFGIPAQAQHYPKPYAVPTDKPTADPHNHVTILGEPEARAAVLNPARKTAAADEYYAFISQVVKSYEESLRLGGAESGALIRTLNGLDGNNPSKYAVHFALEQWFRSNLDAKRFAEWNRLTVYPEYLYSYMLNDPGRPAN